MKRRQAQNSEEVHKLATGRDHAYYLTRDVKDTTPLIGHQIRIIYILVTDTQQFL